MVPATPEFFSAVRELCDETGALMIVDEVQVILLSMHLVYRGALRKRLSCLKPHVTSVCISVCGCPAAERTFSRIAVHTTVLSERGGSCAHHFLL